jgi:hypothetical protein
MMEVKVFNYVNKNGIKSTKVLAVVAETDKYISGISLGHLYFKGNKSDLTQLKKSTKDFVKLDHLPKKGEGLTQFNEHYKMFLKENVTTIDTIKLSNLTKTTLGTIVKMK